MMHSRPIVGVALLLFIATDALPAEPPVPSPYMDYMLKSRTAMIVLDCDPPSCRLIMGSDDDFRWEHGLVLYRATQWLKGWGRFRILDDIREADLVFHLDCAQPDLGNLLFGVRYRWMKMEVYPGGQGWWRKLQPIWKWQLDPVPTCDCKDAVVHILAAYRADVERLDQARASRNPARRGRKILSPPKVR